mgnify:CR=1 FL=1
MFCSIAIALEFISNEVNDKIKVDIYDLIPKNNNEIDFKVTDLNLTVDEWKQSMDFNENDL